MWWWSERGYQPFRLRSHDDSGGGGGGDDSGAKPEPKQDDPPKFEPITSQDDFDRMVKDRLARAEKKAREEAESATREKIKQETEAERAKQQGEFEKLYQAEQAKVADLEKQIADLKDQAAKRDLDGIRAALAKKYGLPDELASRLAGDDEAAIEADAKALAKTVAAKPPNTEGGAGKKTGGKPKGSDSTGYTFGSATRRVPFPDKRPKED